jgi:hypothetical protein
VVFLRARNVPIAEPRNSENLALAGARFAALI